MSQIEGKFDTHEITCVYGVADLTLFALIFGNNELLPQFAGPT
jgi:hypothetical protein